MRSNEYAGGYHSKFNGQTSRTELNLDWLYSHRACCSFLMGLFSRRSAVHRALRRSKCAFGLVGVCYGAIVVEFQGLEFPVGIQLAQSPETGFLTRARRRRMFTSLCACLAAGSQLSSLANIYLQLYLGAMGMIQYTLSIRAFTY